MLFRIFFDGFLLFLLFLSYNPISIETIKKKTSLHIFIIEMLEKPAHFCAITMSAHIQREMILVNG